MVNLHLKVRRAMTNEIYKIGIGNERVYNNDTISYTITVIPDTYPEITAEQFKDSTDEKFFYFLGEINDDYGFKSMQFKYKVEGRDAGDNYFVKEEKSEPVGIPSGVKNNRFTHAFDLRAKTLQPAIVLLIILKCGIMMACMAAKARAQQRCSL